MRMLKYFIGLELFGIYLSAIFFKSRLEGIGATIPDGYILEIGSIKLYNVFIFLQILMDLFDEPTKQTKIFILKSLLPFIIITVVALYLCFVLGRKDTSQGSAELANIDDLRKLYLFKRTSTSPIIGVYEPTWLKSIYSLICNFDKYRALQVKPPAYRVQLLHQFITFLRRIGMRMIIYGKAVTHYLIVGSTGAGKGVGIINPTLLDGWRESCLVTDLKGELWDKTSKYRKDVLGHKVMKFEPAGLDRHSVRWNPISEVRWGTSNESKDVANLAATLIPDPQAGEPFWSESARRFLIAVIIYLKYHHLKETPYHETTLKDVVSFLSGSAVKNKKTGEVSGVSLQNTLKQILKHEKMLPVNMPVYSNGKYTMQSIGMKEMEYISPEVATNKFYPDMHPAVLTTFLEYSTITENTFSGILTSITTPLSPYTEPILAKNTSTCDFHVTDLMRADSPVTLYIVLPIEDQKRLAPLFNLLIDMTMKKLTSDGVDANTYPLLLLLDECANFGKIDSLQRTITAARGYKIQVMMIFQSLKDPDRVYGRENSIINNCTVKIFLKASDLKEKEYISKQIGDTTIRQHNKSYNGFFFWNHMTESSIKRALINPTEVGLLKQSVILIDEEKPIITPYHYYYYDEMFTNREGKADTSSRFTDDFTNCIKAYEETHPVSEEIVSDSAEELGITEFVESIISQDSIIGIQEFINNTDDLDLDDVQLLYSTYIDSELMETITLFVFVDYINSILSKEHKELIYLDDTVIDTDTDDETEAFDDDSSHNDGFFDLNLDEIRKEYESTLHKGR